MSKEEEIRKERGKGYGDILTGHVALGLSWTGILQDYYQNKDLPIIPAHVVCLMLTALKVHRAAKPFNYREDDYVDGRNYFNFAEETDPQNPNSIQARKANEAFDPVDPVDLVRRAGECFNCGHPASDHEYAGSVRSCHCGCLNCRIL